MSEIRHKFENGKYEVVFNEKTGDLYALRHGQAWRHLHGNKLVLAMLQAVTQPIPMLIVCIGCGQQHVDEGEWATKPHRTHLCKFCGLEWRPALVHTVGVEKLPA